MSTAVLTNRLELDSFANKSLRAAVGFWFVVTLISQLAFGFAVASFYSLTALRGEYHGWNFTHGFVPGVTKGNFSVVMHLVSAALIMFSGAAQLVPRVRSRFPVFHHWNGRIYMLAAGTLSFAGVYMHLIRGSVGDLPQHIGATLNAVLIWVFAGLALRYAMARDIATHRRWALRLFLAVSASWFYRLGFFLILAIYRRPVGFDPTTFTGPLPTVMAYAQYVVPLTVLEIYLRAKDSKGALQRMATAALLFVCTLGMAAGTFAVGMAIWVPQVKAGFDSRKSIADTLDATIKARGVDAAVQQYRDLKATQPGVYKFEEDELNNLGYDLLRRHEFRDAIRIFQLDVEAYPQSSNAYDSLAEGYMDDGDNVLAVVNYRKSLQLNPKNANAVRQLKKLGAQ